MTVTYEERTTDIDGNPITIDRKYDDIMIDFKDKTKKFKVFKEDNEIIDIDPTVGMLIQKYKNNPDMQWYNLDDISHIEFNTYR